jgi:hypothetical protein
MKFVLEKDKISGIIFYFDYDSTVYPLNSSSKNKITFYKEELYKPFIDDKFEMQFNNLAKVILNFLYQDDEDSDEGDCMILLDETEKMKSMLENTYKHHMKNEQYKEYVEKLYFLNIELQNKMAMMNYQNRFGYSEENTHRR